MYEHSSSCTRFGQLDGPVYELSLLHNNFHYVMIVNIYISSFTIL